MPIIQTGHNYGQLPDRITPVRAGLGVGLGRTTAAEGALAAFVTESLAFA